MAGRAYALLAPDASATLVAVVALAAAVLAFGVTGAAATLAPARRAARVHPITALREN
jgi:ABC-type lipoprotein release transport system permease subunit